MLRALPTDIQSDREEDYVLRTGGGGRGEDWARKEKVSNPKQAKARNYRGWSSRVQQSNQLPSLHTNSPKSSSRSLELYSIEK